MALLQAKNWSVYDLIKLTKQPSRLHADFTDSIPQERRCSLRHNSQWEVLIRKISASTNEGTERRRRSSLHQLSIPRVQRTMKVFPTGSTYEGTWTVLGMSGIGVYTFTTGAVYTGYFQDGMFHGSGKLTYPNGTVIHGAWERGELKKRKLVFVDGMEYKEQYWSYAKTPDRRYRTELLHGIQPVGRSNITAESSRDIPPGYYDTGDGYYIPDFKSVCSYDDHLAVIRSPSLSEQDWILKNCRKGAEEPVGPHPELYEVFYEPTETLNPTAFILGDVLDTKEGLKGTELEETLRFQKTREKSLGFTPWTEYHRNPRHSKTPGSAKRPSILKTQNHDHEFDELFGLVF